VALSLQVPLMPGWVDETTPTSSYPWTYFRNPTRNGPLQVSWAGVGGGKALQVSEQKLTEMAAGFGEENFGCGAAKDKSNGPCALGSFGSAVFSLPPDRCYGQVWFLSNGTGFLLVRNGRRITSRFSSMC
jgi:hypothetical protein